MPAFAAKNASVSAVTAPLSMLKLDQVSLPLLR